MLSATLLASSGMLRQQLEGQELHVGLFGKTDERTPTARTWPGAARSHVAQHDVYGGHRPVRGDSVRDSGDARTAEPGRLGRWGSPGGARWLHLGGTGRGD